MRVRCGSVRAIPQSCCCHPEATPQSLGRRETGAPLPFLFLFWVCLLAGVLAAANAASTAPPRGSNLRVGVFGAVLGADDGADDGADGGADEEAAELPYEISEHPGDDGVDQDDGDGSADVRMLLADVFKPKDVSSKDSPR